MYGGVMGEYWHMGRNSWSYVLSQSPERSINCFLLKFCLFHINCSFRFLPNSAWTSRQCRGKPRCLNCLLIDWQYLRVWQLGCELLQMCNQNVKCILVICVDIDYNAQVSVKRGHFFSCPSEAGARGPIEDLVHGTNSSNTAYCLRLLFD